MNRRSSGLQLSKALVGFLQYKAAEGLSPNTLRNYEDHLNRSLSGSSSTSTWGFLDAQQFQRLLQAGADLRAREAEVLQPEGDFVLHGERSPGQASGPRRSGG